MVTPSLVTLFGRIAVDTTLNIDPASQLIQTNSLAAVFNQSNITVFIPSNDAIVWYENTVTEVWSELLPYHVASGVYFTDDFSNSQSLSSLSSNGGKLYINAYGDVGKMTYTVNGAIIRTSNIRADNGVMHIIESVIQPAGSTKTLKEYIHKPEIRQLSFTTVVEVAPVIQNLDARTNNSDEMFTSFSVNDSYSLAMPEYGKDILFPDFYLLKNVLEAHVVDGSAWFIPSSGPIPDVHAIKGTLKFTRYENDVYVSNNKVRARIIQRNIPVTNGVLHVIDNLLYFQYENIMQKIQATPSVRVFKGTMSLLPETWKTRLQDPTAAFTMFVPMDKAIGKLPLTQQFRLQGTLFEQILSGHIVEGSKLGLSDLTPGVPLLAMNNRTLTIVHADGDVYVEGGGIRAKLEIWDLGCTNGIVHLISNVLFFDDFTLFDAIEGVPQLSKIRDFVMRNAELTLLLKSASAANMTMFLPSDYVLDDVTLQSLTITQGEIFLRHDDVHFKTRYTWLQMFDQSTRGIYLCREHQALNGHLVPDNRLSSSDVAGPAVYNTLSDKRLSVTKDHNVINVEGTHIRARVIIADIWCSNGVLHVLDDLLHVPVRNILQEISQRDDSSMFRFKLSRTEAIATQLDQADQMFTVFVPHNDAFYKLPPPRSDILNQDSALLEMVVKAHIIPDQVIYLDKVTKTVEKYAAKKNNIYILTENGENYIVNNNVRARIIRSNIPATNGVVHIVETLTYFPYYSIEETMLMNDHLRTYYNIMSTYPAFLKEIRSDGEKTLFVPSNQFLHSFRTNKLNVIENSREIKQQLYRGHIINQVRVDSAYIENRIGSGFSVTNDFGNKFAFKQAIAGHTYVNGGFEDRLVWFVHEGIGCSNGVILLVHGFLNYSPYDLKEAIEKEIILSIFKSIIPPSALPFITDVNATYTMFTPSNRAIQYVIDEGYLDVVSGMDDDLKSIIIWRHTINGTSLLYDEIPSDQYKDELCDQGLSVIHNASGTYIRWMNVEAQIIKMNILATNGIVHIIDTMLVNSGNIHHQANSCVALSPPSTTTPQTTATELLGMNSTNEDATEIPNNTDDNTSGTTANLNSKISTTPIRTSEAPRIHCFAIYNYLIIIFGILYHSGKII